MILFLPLWLLNDWNDAKWENQPKRRQILEKDKLSSQIIGRTPEQRITEQGWQHCAKILI